MDDSSGEGRRMLSKLKERWPDHVRVGQSPTEGVCAFVSAQRINVGAPADMGSEKEFPGKTYNGGRLLKALRSLLISVFFLCNVKTQVPADKWRTGADIVPRSSCAYILISCTILPCEHALQTNVFNPCALTISFFFLILVPSVTLFSSSSGNNQLGQISSCWSHSVSSKISSH